MRLDKYAIRYKNSVTSWDEALPLGNGKLGCLIYGDGPIRLALDRVDLWDTRLHPNTLEKDFTYQNLVKLSTSGKLEDWEERDRLFERVYDENPYPSKITAGRLELDFGIRAQDIQSTLNIQKAVATVQIGDNEIETFLSATEFVGVVKVGGRYAINIHIPEYLMQSEMGYPKANIVRKGEFLYYEQETKTALRYGIVVLQKTVGEHSELYFTIATNTDGVDYIEDAKKCLLKAAACGYETLKKNISHGGSVIGKNRKFV